MTTIEPHTVWGILFDEFVLTCVETETVTRKPEFDFLVCNEFLRTSVAEHLSERGATEEGVINVEYLEKLPPPEPQDCLIHDDWVSAVAVCEKW